MARVRPLDPRLLRYARTTRAYFVVSVALGLATTALVLAQAYLLASTLAAAISDHAGLADMRGRLTALAGVVVARAGVAWAQEVAAHRGAARIKSELRVAVVAHALDLGPGWLAGRRTADLALLVTRGIDALDGYLGRYLPQLILSATMPLAVLVVLLRADAVAALTIIVTLPLIPVLMIFIGLATRRRAEHQWSALVRLSGHFLDAVTGLPTLKVFGRAKAEVEEVGRVTEEYRVATLAQLRVAFLSSLALELVAMLGVAVVAVGVGVRLVDGGIDLRTGLLVLMLAPEAYLPLRQVGALFHASAEGLEAAGLMFAVLEEPLPVTGRRTDIPDLPALRLDRVCVSYPDRDGPALDVDRLNVEAGLITALVGPSGVGKTTLLAVLMGFARPDFGRVLVNEVDLAELDPIAWRRHVAWLGQRPYVMPGLVRDSIRLGDPQADDDAVRAAAAKACAVDLLDRSVGEGGTGLSAGERQRVALARMFLRDAPLLLLDEPTAHLDAATEDAVLRALREHARGRTVLLVAHRPALVAAADRVVKFTAPVAEAVG
jgi:thiol reductant ABC exporter CydD subunit